MLCAPPCNPPLINVPIQYSSPISDADTNNSGTITFGEDTAIYSAEVPGTLYDISVLYTSPVLVPKSTTLNFAYEPVSNTVSSSYAIYEYSNCIDDVISY